MGGFANTSEYQWQQAANVNNRAYGFGFLGALLGAASGVGSSASYGADEDGWHEYCYTQPSPDLLCQFKYYDDGEPWVGYDDLSPETNIGYLKWRLIGIARMQLEGGE